MKPLQETPTLQVPDNVLGDVSALFCYVVKNKNVKFDRQKSVTVKVCPRDYFDLLNTKWSYPNAEYPYIRLGAYTIFFDIY